MSHELNDLAALNARPRDLTVDGKTYAMHPLTFADFGDLQVWVDSQFPNPMDAIGGHLGGLTPAQQAIAIKAAVEEARRPRPRLGNPEADALVQSIDGIRELLYLSIRKGDPAFTREAARDLCGKLDFAKVGEIFTVTGTIRPGVEGDDPKAPTNGTTARVPTGGVSTTA